MAQHHGTPALRAGSATAVLLGILAMLATVLIGSLAFANLGDDEAATPVADGSGITADGSGAPAEEADAHAADAGDSASADQDGATGEDSTDSRGPTAADRGDGTRAGATAPDEPALDPGTEVRLAVVGDIMLSRAVGERMEQDGTEAVLAGVRDQLHDADLTVGNLESPLCTDGTPAPKRFLLKADPVGLEVLQDGSFDVLSLANNHILDYGPECMRSTIERLDGAGIGHVGAGNTLKEAGEPLFVESNGMRIAFLSYLQMPVERSGFDSRTWTATEDSPGLPWGTPEAITEDVEAATPEADHVIVLLHSGWEKTETLSPEQQANGEAALASGATAVLGAHPHRLQAHHEEDGQFVAWSMGNFVFDYPDGTPESDSAVLHLTIDPEGVKAHEWTPVLIQGGFPVAVEPDGAGERILDHLDRTSAEYAATRD